MRRRHLDVWPTDCPSCHRTLSVHEEAQRICNDCIDLIRRQNLLEQRRKQLCVKLKQIYEFPEIEDPITKSRNMGAARVKDIALEAMRLLDYDPHPDNDKKKWKSNLYEL